MTSQTPILTANELSVYLYNEEVLVWLVGWLVGDHLPLRDLELYGIFMNVCCYNRCYHYAVKGLRAL
jgi:hypothetical protein